MSLEAALERNSDTMERLIAALQSTSLPGTPAEPAKPARGKKDTVTDVTPKGTPAPPPADVDRTKVVDGDPAGTLYIHIPKHNTVAAIKPGDLMPSMEGQVEISGTEYLALKVKYNPLPTGATGAQTASPAATPAAATPAASPASSTTPAASAGALDGPAVQAKCKELHGAQGNEGLKAVLAKFGATNVPSLLALTDKFPEIVATIDAMLKPAATAPAAEVNLF